MPRNLYYFLEEGKSGTASSGFVASGADEAALSKTGLAISGGLSQSGGSIGEFTLGGLPLGGDLVSTSGFIASGTDNYEYIKTGAGVLVATGDGSVTDTYEKAGAAILERVASADGRWELAQRNKSLTFAGLGWTLGMAHVASGTNGKDVARSGIAKANFTARGRQGDAVAGSGVSAFVGSGDKSGSTYNKTGIARSNANFLGFTTNSLADVTLNKSGFTVRGYHSDGASAVTYAETGTAISERVASGGSGKAGTGVAPFVASGDGAVEYVESGAAISPFSVSGHAQPGGVAALVFTGGGTWASVFANDNFAAREVIDLPTGDDLLDAGARSYLLYGATERATNESGEPLTGWGSSFTNTLWWEYRVPFPAIVRINVIPLDGGGLLDVTGMLNRGTAVNALSDYADPTLHFGEVGGRGVDAAFATPTSGWASFPHTQSPFAVSLQMDPSTPLVFNAGKRTSLATNVHRHYRISLERLLPPVNDDPSTASFLDAAGGVVTWDMAAATGYSGWNWTQLESLMYRGASANPFTTLHVLSGDIFYKMTPTESGVARIRPITDVVGAIDVTFLIFKGEDPTTWEPVLLNVEDDFPYAGLAYTFNGYTEFEVEADATYIIALLQTRNAGFFNGTPFSLGLTQRRTGTLTWEFVQRPANDDFADRIDLGTASSGSESVADTRGATAEEGEPQDPWFETAVGIWYEFTPPTSGWYDWTIDAFGPVSTLPFLTTYRGNNFTDFEFSYDWILFRPVWMRAGDTYYVRLTAIPDSHADHVALNWVLNVPTVASNDDFADRIAISLDTGEEAVDTTGATTEYGEPLTYYWYVHQEPTVWYEWTAPYEMDVKFTLVSEWSELGVYTGTGVGALTPIARMSSENADCTVSFHALAGNQYQIQCSYAIGGWDFIDPTLTVAEPQTLSWEPTTITTNDTFADAMVITGTANSVSPSTAGHAPELEEGAPDLGTLFEDDLWYGRPAWFKYVPVVTGPFTFSMLAGGWDGTISIYQGETLETLELLDDGNAWDYSGWGESLIDAVLEGGETYYILVTGASFPNDLPLEDPTNDGFAYDMIPQGDFTLSWTSTNVGDQLADASDEFNNLNWFFTYKYGPGEAGEEEQGPFESRGSGACRVASNVGATAEVGEPNHAGVPAERSIWFEWQPGAGGAYDIWVEPAGDTPVQDPRLAIYPFTTNVAAMPPVLASNENFDGLYPRLTVSLTAHTRYLIVVDAYDEGTFEIKVRRVPTLSPPVNDDFADAIVIDPESIATINGTTEGATVECGETPVAGFWGGPYGSVWYTFTPTEDGVAFLNVTDPGTHPEFMGTLFDVFEGSDLNDLRNITDADNFSNYAFDEEAGLPFSFQAGVPIYIRIQTEQDGSDFFNGEGGPFSFELAYQSDTPPDNDDFDDAEDAPSGGGNGSDNVFPGTTDGAGYEPGEVDPFGGFLEDNEPGGGSVWHRYVAPADGFIAVYVTRDDEPVQYWYRVGVWEGTTRETMLKVPTAGAVIPRSTAFGDEYYEVRAGQTYQIQVIREGWQTWGPYDLHIDEYLETIDFELGPDSFTTLVGGASVSDGVLTCTGRQGVTNSRDVVAQYGRLDLGADIRKFARQLRVGFDIRIIGGQVLFRNGSDNWSFGNAYSDDHENLCMRRVGLIRLLDKAGNGMAVLSLAPGGDGENYLELNVQDNYIRPYPISLGVGGAQHDSGWVSIELVVAHSNVQHYSNDTMTQAVIYVYADGRPLFHTNGTEQLHPRINEIQQTRYVDIGMWRMPTISVGNEADYEDPEMWTYQMRNVRITNRLATPIFDKASKGDLGLCDFDGFSPRVVWNKDLQPFSNSAARHTWATSNAGPLPVVDFPDKDWGAFRTVDPGVHASVTYSHAVSSERFYTLSMNMPIFPASLTNIAGYTLNGVGALFVNATGELRIRPYGSKEFCVAHLETDEHYFIEVHIDAGTLYDVRCTVYINGSSFGTFSNKITWTDVGNGFSGIGHSANPGDPTNGFVQFQVGNGSLFPGAANFDFYFTNLAFGRAHPDPVGPIGPLQAVKVAAIQSAGVGHNIPDYPADPADRMLLTTTSSNNPLHNHSLLYNWSVLEVLNAGPIGLTKVGSGHERYYPLGYGTQVYHPYYVLVPTVARLEENVGAGNDWNPIDEGYTQVGDGAPVSAAAPSALLKLTQFGQSVPHADTVTGIEVRVHRRASGTVSDDTVQLYKGGSLVGSNMAAGGTWSAAYEVVTYGGPGDMWGTSWTPEEINADGFGIGVSVSGSGTADIDRVSIKVYFAEAGPGDRYRWGEHNVVEFFATGSSNTQMHAAGFWEPGGMPGGTRGPSKTLSGTPQQLWGSNFPFWGFGGTRTPSVDWTGGSGGETASVTNVRMIRDPLVYPRFAWSTDDGVTYTWITSVGEEDSPIISGDVGDANDTDAIFMDNSAAMDRWEHNVTAGPIGSQAYRHVYHYLTYMGQDVDADEVIAANLYVRWRGCSGYPKASRAGNSIMYASAASNHGGTRRLPTYRAGGLFAANPGGLEIQRFALTRDPDGNAWTADTFNNMLLRVGLHNLTGSGSFSRHNSQLGAALYAATWEVLVPADPDPPPSPCAQLVDLSMSRFASGGGDETAGTTGIDLSDAKFTSGAGEEVGPSPGLDLSTTLFAAGGVEEEE